MSIDYSIRVIEGFRIKYENVFDETEIESTPCDHTIPIGARFCPYCGVENKPIKIPSKKLKLSFVESENDLFDMLSYGGSGIPGTNLGIFQAESNCELTGEERDFLVGEEVFYEDPIRFESALVKLDVCIRDQGRKLEMMSDIVNNNIPVEQDSYGVYILFDAS